MGTNAFDGYFEIRKTDEGVYVKVYEAQQGGANVTKDLIEEGLAKQNIKDYDLNNLVPKLVEGFDIVEEKVSDLVDQAVSSGEEAFKIDITEDKMTARITFYPSDQLVDVDMVERRLLARGVKFGIDFPTIEAIISMPEYNVPIVIASGTPAVDGVPAIIEYHFMTEKDNRPEIDAEGNVNYHKLNMIANVKKGQLLAVLRQATMGEDGVNLYGDILPPKKPKTIKLKYGKNTVINEARTELYAACDGLVKIENEKVVVNDVFDVPGNVGVGTGDVEFEGTIIIHGNVQPGFSIRAKGDIEVIGVVEGAEIYSGGNIILHKGVQGRGDSKVEAVGYVQAKYIENAYVVSGGDVHSEAILHSKVICKGSITVEGKKGMISGGTVQAGEYVKSKILGSNMGTVTNVEVGIDPIMLSEYGELKKEIPKMENETTKLEQVITLLNKRKEMAGGTLEDDKQEMYMSAVRNKIFLTNKLNQAKRRYDELETQVNNKNNGYVEVTNEIYPGVKVTIGNISTYVRDELKFIRMVKKGADIKMSSL